MRTVATISLLGLACLPVCAADLTGHIVGTAGPLSGAMITATGANGVGTTVYSQKDGAFSIAGLAAGSYQVRGRVLGNDDVTATASAGGPAVTLNSKPGAEPLLNAPSSTWMSLLPEGEEKRRFIVNCTACHEFSWPRIVKDGKIRDEAKWNEAITLMKAIDAYKLVSPALDAKIYAPWLAKNLSPERISTLKPPGGADPARVGKAVITEFPVPISDELPHDVAIGPDGRIWSTAFWHGKMWNMDPTTGHIDAFDVNTDPKTVAQVRALQIDHDGNLWIVLGGTKAVVRLNPKTREIKTFPVGIYAHDIVLDSKGNVWLNDYFSQPESISELDVTTGKVTNYPLPTANLPAAEGFPLPYGLQIDAQDRLWSTQLNGNTLVRFDTRSKQAKMYRMPVSFSGPRRHGIAKDGSVWIPEYNTGYLTRFDPKTEKFERFKVGESALGEYDLCIDPRDQGIWITGSLASALLRFDPKTHAIERYPLPTEPAYMRHIAIDPNNGDVWSAYSSLPTVVPKIVRLHRGQ